VASVLLMNMHFALLEAAGLFVLWLVQFLWADSRELITVINFIWAAALLVWLPLRGGGFPAVRLGWRLLVKRQPL